MGGREHCRLPARPGGLGPDTSWPVVSHRVRGASGPKILVTLLLRIEKQGPQWEGQSDLGDTSVGGLSPHRLSS